MSKRTKINFETINSGKYNIIDSEKIEVSRQRIKSAMKKFLKKAKSKANKSFLYSRDKIK